MRETHEYREFVDPNDPEIVQKISSALFPGEDYSLTGAAVRVVEKEMGLWLTEKSVRAVRSWETIIRDVIWANLGTVFEFTPRRHVKLKEKKYHE